MTMSFHLDMPDAARERVASRFRALGEPMRLRMLQRLFRGPASVGEILDSVGGTQANVSKHLALLHNEGLVERRKDGTRTVYSIADPTLLKICSIVCDEVEREARESTRAILGTTRRRAGHAAR
jgi:DNA-binding transcriptional ArsR family regulator